LARSRQSPGFRGSCKSETISEKTALPRVERRAAILCSKALQELPRRQSSIAVMGWRQFFKQSGGLLLNHPLAVKTVARMVNIFHRAKTVEPAKEPLAEGVLA